MPVTVPAVREAPGSSFGKLLKALGVARGDLGLAQQRAERDDFRSAPHVAATIEGWRHKGAIPAGMLSTPTYAGNLASYGVEADVITLYRNVSAFAQLEQRCHTIPFHVQVPTEASAGTTGGWRGEGKPAPLASSALDHVDALEPLAFGVVKIVTAELVDVAAPASDVALRQLLLTSFAAKLDAAVFDPSVNAVSPFPASLTNGAPAIASSPGTITATDLNFLIESITTGGARLAWVASAQTYARVLALADRVEAPGQLCGLPVIIGNLPRGLLVILDLDEIVIAAGGFELSVSRQGAIEMLNNSLIQDGTNGTGAYLVSLWQVDAVAMRLARYVNFTTAHSGAVAYTLLG